MQPDAETQRRQCACFAALGHAVLVPFEVRTGVGTLSFFSTTTEFGTPIDIALSELVIELFLPADVAAEEAVRKLSTIHS